jgi:N-acetylneuraminic acid mutarotase
MPRPEAGAAVGVLHAEIVVAGGTAWDGGVKAWLNEVQIYNPARNEWRPGPSLPAALAYGPAVHGPDSLEILGGANGTEVHRQSWKLNGAKTEWEPSGKVPADTLLAVAASVNSGVFLFGGCPDVADLTGCSEAVRRRGSDAEWTRVATLPSGPLALAASATANGQIYLFGGCSMPQAGVVVNHSKAYRFDPQSAEWASLHPLPAAIRGASAVAVDSRHIYILGGYGETFRSDVWIYDVQKDRYERAEPLPVALMSSFVLIGNALYGAGGEDRPRARSSRTLIGALAQ